MKNLVNPFFILLFLLPLALWRVILGEAFSIWRVDLGEAFHSTFTYLAMMLENDLVTPPFF